MKIKRFTGTDMRQTIRQGRDSLGAHAIILSNRKLADGMAVSIMREVGIGSRQDPISEQIIVRATHANG